MVTNPIRIVQGGQWGSEAKGAIAAYICLHENIQFAVRTGAVNAGHTVWDRGREWKMQQLPVGFVNPDTALVLGAGALVHPEILEREVRELEEAGYKIRHRLYIDHNAGLHLPVHTERSTAADRHHLIGATGKGCSEALIDRIRNRGKEQNLFRDHRCSEDFALTDTASMLNDAYDEGANILLEGTQGSGLDLYFGPYPYTTHKPCQAATWIQEAGLSPSLEYEVVLVVRTYPIRVAGNSGPMPNEISWTDLALSINSRLMSKGLHTLISGESILRWEEMCQRVVSSGTYLMPDGVPRWDFHRWTPAMRHTHRIVISECHRDAFNLLSEKDQAELRKLFEFTTVTKKLRRVAELSKRELKRAVMLNRPHYIALTFMNYVMPEIWGATELKGAVGTEVIENAAEITKAANCPVRLISTGPLTEHIHLLDGGQEKLPIKD